MKLNFLDLLVTEEFIDRKICERQIRGLDDTILCHLIKATTTTNKIAYDGWIGVLENYIYDIKKNNKKLKTKKSFSAQRIYDFLWGEPFIEKHQIINFDLIYRNYSQQQKTYIDIINPNVDSTLMGNVFQIFYQKLSNFIVSIDWNSQNFLEQEIIDIRKTFNIEFIS